MEFYSGMEISQIGYGFASPCLPRWSAPDISWKTYLTVTPLTADPTHTTV